LDLKPQAIALFLKMSKTIEFFIEAFDASIEKKHTQLISLIDQKMTTLLQTIEQLKAEQTLTQEQVTRLNTTILEEREQVGGLINIASAQQETIVQLNTKIEELMATIDIKDADNQAAVESVNELLAEATEQSEQIETAITGIQEIYNPA
jgi:chromosome segregation ATPase